MIDDDLPQNTGADDDLPQVLADTVTDLLGRPKARGWIHFCSAVAAIVAGVALVSAAWLFSSGEAVLAASIYTATIVAMFSFSALYHRVHWQSPTTLKWMKRIDHSLIFVFIAGSFTPFCMLAMPPDTGSEVLLMVWGGAAAGVALKMWWPSAPRWVGVPLYLLLGYTAIWFAGTLLDGAGHGRRRPARQRRGAVQHRRRSLRRALAQPVAANVRLSRVLSRVHRRRSDLPLHRHLVRRRLMAGV